MNKPGRVIVLVLVIMASGFNPGAARAADWMAYGDFSGCYSGPGGYDGRSSGENGPFSSEAECESFVSSASASNNMACARYECREEGGDDSSADSSGADLSSIPLSTGGLTTQQQLGLGIGMIGAYMVGKGLHDLLIGNPQQEAARKAQEAARAAEQRRQAAEQAKKAEETKERLLGEIQGSGTGSTQLSLMGTTKDTNLQLMTGGDALAPMTGSVNRTAPKVPTFGKKKVKHSDAFHMGYFDGSQCYSQNAGPYCNGKTGDTWQACLADYRAGYEVGTREMQMKVKEATRLGLLDEESGSPNKGFSEMPAFGDCRTQLNEAYNNGYTQGQQAKAVAGNKQGN